MQTSTLRCGVSGWNYPQWDRLIYPRPTPKTFHPVEYLAERFDTIELPNSGPGMARPELARLWATRVAHNPRFQFTARLHRSFTFDRALEKDQVREWSNGMRPLLERGKLGAVLMEFPETFRFTAENRDFLIQLRRTFHEFPLVAELPHATWTTREARGTLIDYHVGFCNTDHPAAEAGTTFMTWRAAYVRLTGQGNASHFYSPVELENWKRRIEKLAVVAESTFVVFANHSRGKSVVNALQMQALCKAPMSKPARTQPATRVATQGMFAA